MFPTESPWLAVLICGLPAAVLGSLALQRRSGRLGAAAALCTLAAVAAVVIDQWVLTDREQVAANITGLVRAFEAGDLDRTLSYVSPRAVCERELIRFALGVVTCEPPLSIKDRQVTLQNENSLAIATFRVNGTVRVRGQSSGHQPTMWRSTWRKEADAWKLIRIQELDPIRAEPLERVRGLGASPCP